jgi:hypothetical protein
MSHAELPAGLHGLMAEFETGTALVHAAEQARLAGADVIARLRAYGRGESSEDALEDQV